MNLRCDHLLIDSKHAMWRSADSFKDLSAQVNGKLMKTGAMYGYLGILIRIFRKYGGTVEVAWEGPRARNFRKALYPEYKLRKEPDAVMAQLLEDMHDQEPRLKAILRALGIRQHEGAGGEADDVLAMLASRRKGKVIIYTGDGDLRQLSDDRVTIVAPGFRGDDTVYTPERVRIKHGVKPKQIPCLKAIGGDTGDNIPGVKGIGQKTSSALVSFYGDCEKVIEAAKSNDPAWPVQQRYRQMILNEQENIRLYRKLTVVDPERATTQIECKKDKDKALAYLNLYKFRSLAAPSEFYDLWHMGNSGNED